MTLYHTPVLLQEVIESLEIQSGKRYIDATLGGGGYGWEIVKRGGILLGIDTDEDAVAEASSRFKVQSEKLGIEGNWKIVHGNFRDIGKIAKEHGFTNVHGIVFDLGVSSHQLDTPQRGFSYRFEGAPLDMRLDTSQEMTAAQLVNTVSEDELYEIFATYGEEQRSRAIARAVVFARRVKPLKTTGDLVSAVQSVPGATAPGVLSRIFQAMRIAVNDELGALKTGIAQAIDLLEPGGRMAIVTFHSLEDRIVKRMLIEDRLTGVTKKPVRPTNEEQKNNVRSRSAKLRVAEKRIL